MKIIVAGSRDFTDYDTVHSSIVDALYELEVSVDDIIIVSGCAKGVDTLGEQFAKNKYIDCIKFPADWAKYGKRAGPLRNIQMGDYADALVAIRKDGSKGTTHMINYMLELGKPVFVTEVE